MGIFSDLKKIIFGAESIGKSAINKGKDFASETGEDFLEKASSIGESLKDKAEDLGENVIEKTSGLRDAILHQAEGTISMVSKSETLKNVAEKTERIGEKILDKGEELYNQGTKKVEELGQNILGENNENLEKAKDFTTNLGEKVMDTKDKLMDKAEDLYEDISEKIDTTLDRAKKEDIEEAMKPKKDLQEILDENEGSLLKDKDDFFSKAEKFSEGDYQGAAEGQITVEESSIAIEEKAKSKAAGFEDLDGDGNELVDDALIVSEEE